MQHQGNHNTSSSGRPAIGRNLWAALMLLVAGGILGAFWRELLTALYHLVTDRL